MKGSVFNGFEAYIEQEYGLHIWQQVIENTALESNGIYLGSETYEDQELFSLLDELANLTDCTANDIQRSFGCFFFQTLFSLTIEHISNVDNLFDFLKAVDDVIHVEVKKADPAAYTPAFFYDSPKENILVMRYVSKRGMCYFAEGLILGAAKHFNTPVQISQSKCVHCGDDYCLINIET
ncbi:heme NO-binding domain-containing protein [Colwellia sp. D2M02]|uniref:heme NO-binding domain-containing protein n=1 Tax=Colwellia sp. D2M02 TaxID=2841562 RepID=UPI001C0A5463|nr:heme NO-binding domain-containing protein [Colwellia sp. D2M02]MBU2893645.1 heme NO-binding domain-containing protein [Colwellia sp. D2M02]